MFGATGTVGSLSSFSWPYYLCSTCVWTVQHNCHSAIIKDTKEVSYKHYWCSVQLFAWYKVSLELKRNTVLPFIEVSWKVGIITWRVHPTLMATESLYVKLREPELSLPIPWLLCGVRRLASATAVSTREKKYHWMIAWFIRHPRKARKIGLKKWQPCLFLTRDPSSMCYPKRNQELQHVWGNNAVIKVVVLYMNRNGFPNYIFHRQYMWRWFIRWYFNNLFNKSLALKLGKFWLFQGGPLVLELPVEIDLAHPALRKPNVRINLLLSSMMRWKSTQRLLWHMLKGLGPVANQRWWGANLSPYSENPLR